jgi:hypothetical protein
MLTEKQTPATPPAPSPSGSDSRTLLSVPFQPDEVNLDEIVPFAAADAQTALDILKVRALVGELLFAREEDLCVAEIADLEAGGQEKRAEVDEKLAPLARRILQAQARRNRLLAERSRFRSRQRELEILSHLKRKNDPGEAEENKE